MTAIGGCISWDGKEPSHGCVSILHGMNAFGDRLEHHSIEGASFGLVAGTLPGERAIAHDDRFLLITDSRIDQVEGETASTQCSPNGGRLLACWRRWGSEMFERIDGDFALAIWDREERKLYLARSALSSRFLSYRAAGQNAWFATFPAAIAADGLNYAELAERLSGFAHFGSSSTVYNGVEAVEPGTFVCIGADRKHFKRFWRPESIDIKRRSDREAADQLRDLLQQAVAYRTGSSGPVASHLSGGRDSSAVSLVAARVLAAKDRRLMCFTAAPRAGWPERANGYVLDESSSASALVNRLPNADHRIVRSKPFALALAMDDAHRVHHQPLTNPVNTPWWDRILGDAAAAGASLLLTGTCGNYGLSAGGPLMLADLLRKDSIGAWARKAAAIGGTSPTAWRNNLNLSFGHRVAPGAFRFMRRAMGRADAPVGYPFLSGQIRERAEAIARERTADERPPASYRELLCRTLEKLDNADKMGLVCHGIDVRDPTADRQLVSFALSLTDEQLTSAWSSRTIYDLAFGSDLPQSVIKPAGRGHQSSDWNEVIDPRELRDALGRYSANPLVREMVDVKAMAAALDEWPSGLAIDPATYRRYAEQLLLAFSLASFISVQNPACGTPNA